MALVAMVSIFSVSILHCPMTAVVGFFLMCVLLRGLYNRYFHPLKNIPGPFWSSVSGFSLPYLFKKSSFQRTELKLHKEYGELLTHKVSW